MVKQKLRIRDFTPEYSAMKKLYNDYVTAYQKNVQPFN
ncbi:hypothetical protein PC129_g10939 [Phytophthora cactorum]|nr:hypothetical protein Pcac1_g12967 [Phytophthora cactorum]KAG2819931.1 hypothetical protein PC111_g11685 [Phytophthora cactorum]KAG2833313.1 hypothetical protein PC112_g6541 [Phytophthora cactorum]KAG2859351.1 hypothetical protein PC113_g9018 [Phytophthora cactorum]KAG2899469.1 hypothetical protein PC114_g13928 [Phytophthora cactorum]